MALLLIQIVSPVTAHAQGAKGRTLSGVVLDADAKPVGHATVAVTGGTQTATTGDDGAFTLAGVPATAVTLDITAEGYTAKQVPVLNGTTAAQLSLVIVKTAPPAPPPTRAIGGVVTDAAHVPIAGATVRIHGTELQVQTDADGSFNLAGAPAADVTLDIEAPNQPPTTATVAAAKAAVAITVGQLPAAPTSRSVHGKVLDPSNKEPIVAAQVQVVGTETVVFTEADGAYQLDGLPLGPVQLEITAPEHEKRTVTIAADQPGADVALALVQGEQIIIEGRAPVIVKESAAHGSSTIGGKDLTRVSASTLDEAMQGKLAGANLQQNSGAPGGGAQLRLRGVSTINGQSSPLYVIDGVIISNVSVSPGANILTSASAGGSTSTQDNPTNRIADLNPNDIERVEVLKGASAAALYGSKAANGVVVITTKHGKSGESHAEITQRIGFAQVSNSLGSRTFTSADDVAATFGATSPFVAAFNNAHGKTYDHEGEIERTPFMRETIASVSGGTENGNYFASMLLNDEPGVVIGTFYQKQSGRVSVGYKFSDRVRLNASVNLIHSLSDRGLTNNDNAGVSNFVVFSSTPSFFNLQPNNGVYPANPGVGAHTNPLQTVELFQNREDVWRLITGSTLSIDAYKSDDGHDKVTVLGNFGADDFTQHNNILSPNQLIFESADGLPGTSVNATTTNLNWNTGASVIWDHKADSFHNAVSAGVTYESVDLDSVYTFAQNLNASQANVDSGAAITLNENRLRTKDSGLYAQEEIAVLDDQLSLSAGLLFERSSLNGDTDKYYVYPKVAAVYSAIPSGSKDGLAEHFDALRIRAAYGEAGNRPNYGQKFTPLNATTNIDGNAG
ncbi:MAG TPA: carboxypeptidase regulatory-like domain-containing protein, partial [Kofleriaceae bacterium]